MEYYKEWGSLDGMSMFGNVIKIHDGDTVKIAAPVGEAGGIYLITCRLSGINAPELSKNTSSKLALEKLINETNGKVYCIFGKKEKYGRILTTLYGDPTKLSINQRMIDIGEAISYEG